MPISKTDDPRESVIEKYLHDQTVLRGGRTYKWVRPGRRGANDRIVVLAACPHCDIDAAVCFVEVKKRGGPTSKQQAATHKELSAMGATAVTLASFAQVDFFLAAHTCECTRGC